MTSIIPVPVRMPANIMAQIINDRNPPWLLRPPCSSSSFTEGNSVVESVIIVRRKPLIVALIPSASGKPWYSHPTNTATNALLNNAGTVGKRKKVKHRTISIGSSGNRPNLYNSLSCTSICMLSGEIEPVEVWIIPSQVKNSRLIIVDGMVVQSKYLIRS